MQSTRRTRYGRWWVAVVATLGCSQPEPVAKPTRGAALAEPPHAAPLDARPSRDAPSANVPDAPALSVQIAPLRQMFTTKGPPMHVWFEVTSDAPELLESLALEYVDGATTRAVTAFLIRVDETEHRAASVTSVTVPPGRSVLDLHFARADLPHGLQTYRFRLRAKTRRGIIVAENTVGYAHRTPHTR